MAKTAVKSALPPDLGQRVRRRLTQLGRSPIEAAQRVGLERNYLRDLTKDKKNSLNQRHLSKVAAALDWTVGQLLGENIGAARIDGVPNVVAIPEIDIKAGAGYGGGLPQEGVVIDEDGGEIVGGAAVRATWSFPVPFMREELRVRRAHILAIRGDSMTGALYDGDRAIVDLDDVDVSQGGIFALLDDLGTLIVKQVELIRGSAPSRILCTSRNVLYKPFELLLEDPVRIIGRVASKITRL